MTKRHPTHHELEALGGMEPTEPSSWRTWLVTATWMLGWVGLYALINFLES